MHYAVTGGAGFIGSHLCDMLTLAGHEVTVVDDLSSGRMENIAHLLNNPHVRFIQETIMDFAGLVEHFHGVDGVFHQAALVSVPRSVSHPMASHDVTLTGTLNVLLAARDTGVRKVVFASSAAVYGNLPDVPKREDMPVDPRSPYAVAKLAGEYYCRVFSSLYGLETTALRYFNVYGPRQDPHSDYSAVIPRFFARIRSGDPPVIYGDGEQTRDFVYVKDVVRANIRAMESGAAGVYNIGSGMQTSVNRLADTMLSLFGAGMKPVFTTEQQGEVKHSVADISEAGKAFGYSPEYTLKKGLNEMMQWQFNPFRQETD